MGKPTVAIIGASADGSKSSNKSIHAHLRAPVGHRIVTVVNLIGHRCLSRVEPQPHSPRRVSTTE